MPNSILKILIIISEYFFRIRQNTAQILTAFLLHFIILTYDTLVSAQPDAKRDGFYSTEKAVWWKDTENLSQGTFSRLPIPLQLPHLFLELVTHRIQF